MKVDTMSAQEEAPPPEPVGTPKKGLSPVMMIGIGSGVFILQSVLVYLLIVFVLVPKMSGGAGEKKPAKTEGTEQTEEANGESKDAGKFVLNFLIFRPN